MNIHNTDLHQFDLRYQHTRVVQRGALNKLVQSISQYGQQLPVIATKEKNGLVLIDGYLRFSAMRQLNKDTINVQVLTDSAQQALIHYLGQLQNNLHQPIEQAWMIVALIEEGMPQAKIAPQLGRDKSWVSRRLSLVTDLPDEIQQAIRQGEISSWVANRIFKPLARANAQHAKTLLNVLKKHPMSSRELARWFSQYQTANQGQRTLLVEQPALLLRALKTKDETHQHEVLQSGPEGDWLHDLQVTQSLIKRLMKPLHRLLAGQSTQQIDVLSQHFTALDQQYHVFQQQFQEVINAYRRDPPDDSTTPREGNLDTRNQPTTQTITQHRTSSDSSTAEEKVHSRKVAAYHIEASRTLLADKGECRTDSGNTPS